MSGDWRLALEQSTDLTVVNGSRADVAAAVRRGADLRLYMTTERYEETVYFQQTYSGDGTRFSGLMSHHHSYKHRGSIAEQPYISLFRYDDSGTYAHYKWMLDNTVIDEAQTYPYGTYRWYICDRWRPVYEHDPDGNRVSGDLDELKVHVREGRTIRLGVRQLFGLANDRTEGPDHRCFMTPMQPLIAGGHVHANCDLVVVGAPHWPIVWSEGVSIGMMQPSTSGDVLCFVAEVGKLPFVRMHRRRAIQWLVAERA